MNCTPVKNVYQFCLFVGALILLPLFSNAQFEIEWDKTYGGAGWEELNATVLTDDGGYLFCGTTFSNIGHDVSEEKRGDGDYWVVRTDGEGKKIWDRRYGGSDRDRLRAAIKTNDGGFLLGGHSGSPASGEKSEDPKGEQDYWVIKIDENGEKIWDKTIGGARRDTLFSIIEAVDGYVLCGFSNSDISADKSEDSRGKADYWIVKIDLQGQQVLWDKTYGGNERDQLFTAKRAHDGGYILGGSSSSVEGQPGEKQSPFYGLNEMWLVKTDAQGNLEWEKSYGGDGQDVMLDLLLTNDGGYVLCGHSSSSPDSMGNKTAAAYGHVDYWIVKVDGNGVIEWDYSFGGNSADVGYGILENSIGNFIVSGVSESDGESGNKNIPPLGGTSKDFWLLYITPSGEILWQAIYGGTAHEVPPEIHHAHGGGYIFGGHSASNSSEDKSEDSRGLNDFWIVKTLCPLLPPDLLDIVNECSGQTIKVDATIGDCEDCIYTWEDGYVGATRTLSNETLTQEYEITYTHPDGCEKTGDFKVELVPTPEALLIEKSPITCFGDTDGKLKILGVEGGTPPFTFNLNGVEFSDLPEFEALAPGLYDFSVIDEYECQHDTTILLEQPEEPLVRLGEDLTIEWGDSVQIQALITPNVANFNWSSNNFLSCEDCLIPFAAPLETSLVSITVRDSNQCEAKDYMTIWVERNINVYIPNVFSPNNDGENDFFTIFSNQTVRIIHDMKLYTRWGELVFERSEFPPNVEHLGWNGKLDGKFLKPGVFVYWLELEYIDGRRETFKGDVTLVR